MSTHKKFLKNSVTITVDVGGQTAHNVSIPTPQPLQLFKVIQQTLGAMASAHEKKQKFVLGIMPAWKVWIMRHVLRAL